MLPQLRQEGNDDVDSGTCLLETSQWHHAQLLLREGEVKTTDPYGASTMYKCCVDALSALSHLNLTKTYWSLDFVWMV